jgi:hypothetical protein
MQLKKRSDASTGSGRGELSTAVPREAKPPAILDSDAVFVVIWTGHPNWLSEPGYLA